MSKLKKVAKRALKLSINPTKLADEKFRRQIAYDITDPDISGKLGDRYQAIGRQVAPIALSFIPVAGPAIAAAYSAANNYGQGGSLGSSLAKGGISYLGSRLSGGSGGSAASSGATSAAAPSLLSRAGTAVSGALSDIGDYTGLGDILTGASGALGDAYKGVSDAFGSAYEGSGLQDVYHAGKDALKSIGIGGSSGVASTSAAPVAGGAGSSFVPPTDSAIDAIGKGTAASLSNPTNYSDITAQGLDGISNGFGAAANNTISKIGDSTALTSTALNTPLNTLSTGGNVATRSLGSYISPLASLGIGEITNENAKKSLKEQAQRNKDLLQPYQNFSFNPGDLTQDPGYKFDVEQGNQAIDRRALAGGGYFSGNALKEAQQFGQGLADKTYNSAFNRALQTNQQGLNALAPVLGYNDSIGNINATSAINSGNLFSGALGNVLGGQSYTNSGALQGGNDIQSLLRQLGIM